MSGVGFLAGTTIAAYAIERDQELFVAGVAVILLSGMAAATQAVIAAIEKANREASAAFELGRDIGHDQGYMEGRRVARPVVVPLSHHDCGHHAATGSEG